MADHTKFVALAQRLIDAQGRSIELQALSAVAADPTKPWRGAGAPTASLTVPVKAVFLPAGGSGFGKMAISKEMLAQVTQVALVAPNDVDLETMTVLVDGGKTYKIEWCSVLKPADQVCLYAFGVMR